MSAHWQPVTQIQARRYRLTRQLRPSVGRFAGEIYDGSLWLEVDLSKTWRAAYRIVWQGPANARRAVIAEVRLFSAEAGAAPGEWSGSVIGPRARVPAGGIPAAVLKRLRSKQILADLRATIGRLRERYGTRLARVLLQDELPGSQRGRGRPPSQPVTFYAKIARRIAELDAERPGGGARIQILKEFKAESEHAVARWITQCRKLGFLEPSRQGRRQWVLTAEGAAAAAKLAQ